MQSSIYLAKLIGPICVLVAAGLLLNRRAIDALAREILGSTVLLLLLGTLDFAAGLAIVLAHNVWVADWRVIITILGWLLMLRGVARVLIPNEAKDFGSQVLKNKNAVTAILAGILVLGLVLSYFGYAR
jgi:hypothetical protein